jgi:hypothetical protein
MSSILRILAWNNVDFDSFPTAHFGDYGMLYISGQGTRVMVALEVPKSRIETEVTLTMLMLLVEYLINQM